MQPDQEVIRRWSGSARFWEKHREIIRQMFAPVTQALVDEGQIGSRHTVLDIATGPGEPALSLAASVGPEGKIFGIDPIPEMVAAARRAAGRLALKICNLTSPSQSICRFQPIPSMLSSAASA